VSVIYSPHHYPHTAEELEANLWEPITEAQALDWLGAVPPKRQRHEMFAVGEAWTHLLGGRPTYIVCIKFYGQWYARPETLDRFDRVVLEPSVRQTLFHRATHLTREAWRKMHRDFRSEHESDPRVLVLCPSTGATISAPVTFTN
jgi:hypothetical protein